MTYEECVDFLFTATPVFEHVGATAYKPGLQTSEALDAHYSYPHHSYKTIHVAGTNGKGSTSHTLAAVLQALGYKVGLYTSPHLVDFRERIKVNGLCISKKRVVDFVDDYIHWNKSLSPSFFELTTALAFKYFEEEKVDVAIIEVGLGGRLDSTNIITPILSVITNISYDHTQFLGNTISEIASEKAGIIKEHIPVVIGEATSESRPVFEQKAQETASCIFFAQEVYPTPPQEMLETFELKGNYQKNNLCTILTALKVLDSMDVLPVKITPSSIITGLSHVYSITGLRGRWEVIQANPLVVCDTGHNLAGWQYLAPQIKKQPCETLRIVFGMVDDKDIEGVMNLLPSHAHYYFTQATTHRAVPVSRVAELAKEHGLSGTSHPDVVSAYQAALGDASRQDFIFVGGSSYVVADLLAFLQ